MQKKLSKQQYTINAVAVFVLIGIIWFIITRLGLIKPMILPKPAAVWNYIYNGFTQNHLLGDVLISIQRILLGFILSVVIGVPLGILAGTSSIADSLMKPLCEFTRYLPVPTLVPLVMVWCGIGENAKVMVLFLGCVFQLLLMVADAASNVSADLVNAAYTLGATRIQVLVKILFPAALPRIMDTLRMIIGWAWGYLTLAEMFAASSGLGYLILRAQHFMQTDAIFALILLIGLLGLITDRIFYLINKSVFHWVE